MRQNSIDQGTTSDSVESNTTEKNDSASSSSSSVTSSCSSSSSLLPSYRLLPPPSFPSSSFPSPSFPSSSSPSQRRRKCIVTTVWSCSKIYIFTFHDSSGNSVRFHTQDIYVPITVRWVIFLRLCSFVRKGDLSDVRSLFTPRKESFYDQILETVINAHLWLWLNIDVICLKREAKLL